MPKKAAKKKPVKKAPKKKLEVVNLKVSSKDRAILERNAKRFAKGNLSAWLRCAGLQYAPAKDACLVLDAHH